MRTTVALPSGSSPEQHARGGVVSAVIAYVMWGVFPVYFKIAEAVPPLEMLSHRVVWAIPFGALIIAARGQWPEVWRALKSPRMLLGLAVAAVFIALNWLVYIWAVQHDSIFEASLGYYINPLMYVLVGVMVFGERLRRAQLVAVMLAALGVAVLTIDGGRLPWISLVLAVSFTIYGIIRKQIAIGAMPGLFVETMCLFPLFFVYLLWLGGQGATVFSPAAPGMMTLLLLAGPLTVLPLLFFAISARRLRLSTLGFLQFIGPTLQFLVGIIYGEVLTVAHVICFSLIWLAVGLFSVDAWRSNRRPRPTV